jgi:hypothetical protein
VAEGMGVHTAFDPRSFGKAFEQRPNVGGAKGSTSKSAEERLPTVQAKGRATVDYPLPNQGKRFGVEPNGPVTGLSARDANSPRSGVKIGGSKR